LQEAIRSCRCAGGVAIASLSAPLAPHPNYGDDIEQSRQAEEDGYQRTVAGPDRPLSL
jgi:hypothetical protein